MIENDGKNGTSSTFNDNCIKFTFYQYPDRNCNEIQFSSDNKYMACGFYNNYTTTSDLLIFNVSDITNNLDNLDENLIKSCNTPVHNLTLNKIKYKFNAI